MRFYVINFVFELLQILMRVFASLRTGIYSGLFPSGVSYNSHDNTALDTRYEYLQDFTWNIHNMNDLYEQDNHFHHLYHRHIDYF